KRIVERFFFVSSSKHGLASLQSSAIGDAIKPVADFLARHDARRPPNQNQKSGLKGILGVRLMADDTSADAQNHRPMPTDERFKGTLVPLPDEAFQQLTVRQPSAVFEKHSSAKALQNLIGAASSHNGDFREDPLVSPIIIVEKSLGASIILPNQK